MTRIIIDSNKKKSKISKHIYSHFSEHLGRCIYEGIYVGKSSEIENVNGMRKDVVKALKEMGIPSLRWPGGCFADEYHWKDGIGEKSKRKKMINNHWGGLVEDNSFGTHEFLELCKQLECEPYINGNMGSGTVQEMQEWVEYMTSSDISPMTELRRENGQEDPYKVKYFGIGNENWGCGGNMCASYYSQEYKKYATYVREYGGNKLFKIACGAGVGNTINGLNLDWTEEVMKNVSHLADGYSLHYYTVPSNSWECKGSATDFTLDEYYITLRKATWIDEIIKRHAAIMKKYDEEKRVKIIFDEWGTWYDVLEGSNPGFLFQQNTMRDALVASLSLDIFNKHSDIVHMANIAQIVNVLQSVILTEGDKIVLTPTYHVFKLYQEHQEATLLESFQTVDKVTYGIETNLATDDKSIFNPNAIDRNNTPLTAENLPLDELSHTASINELGEIFVTISNCCHDKPISTNMVILGGSFEVVAAEILTGDFNEYNDFDAKNNVCLKPFKQYKKTVIGEGLEVIQTVLHVTLPKCSVVSIKLKK
ncbi:alpha-N-arabinofuranosidase [Enterococcus aquimarinus]|uniref:non-reducing end alpha-L-arabinofuranosidase n=2 Tax=Enterococcus aquimarinus TaxID=328396 RepID=A0A1L8QMU9_9ENTE|nr:alpha-L-arabinofuranosidase C-terminal domain-containing protein [Enterococcus aquimarinus]OJG08833.1 alpha-N-arabinofuranosidase [Enterococcus aquimarinus]